MAKGYGVIKNHGESVQFCVMCSNDRAGAGEMCFRLTKEMTRNRKGIVPQKVCKQCLKSYPVIAFIKKQEMAWIQGKQYSLITDTELCHNCDPPPVFLFVFSKSGQLKMRLELHYENGELVDIWDPSYSRWQLMRERGLRLMTADGNVVRFQPRSKRNGEVNGHGTLPLDHD